MNCTSADKYLAGYPSTRMAKSGYNLSGKPIAFQCSPCPSIPASATQPVNPDLDIFLDYPMSAIEKGGKVVSVEGINGMSGSAIWEIHEALDQEVWTPERALRLVGIQSAAKKGSYVRGNKWAFLREAFKRALQQ